MTPKILPASHVDHGLSEAQLHAAIALCVATGGYDGTDLLPRVVVLTVQLPLEHGTVPCGLYGPAMGDGAIPEADVIREVRGCRAWPSRLVDRPYRQVRDVTVVAGPYAGEPLVLYTAYGGPAAPREPEDPSLSGAQLEESKAFWDAHALSWWAA